MNGDVEEEAPRPRPLSAGIWTLFSWLRRSDRTSSSESVSSVGSDRTVASFDFLAPLNYKKTNTPLVLPLGPLTDTYKQRLHERNLRRQHDRDLTLRRKYGLFREEGLGYDAFSLPVTRRLQKDKIDDRQDRGRRATSESTRRSAYVPGKRRAPLPPTIIVSATLPRTYKRKRPAPKPPSISSEENKENVETNKIIQMDSTDEIGKQTCRSKDIIASSNKTEKHSKHETKEIKLRTDKSFLKQIFDGKKRNSAIDTSRIKYLPSISELDKQAAAIIEANKALQTSGQNNSSLMGSDPRSTSSEETWICTACFRKYKPVVTCCIYCVIKESSIINKDIKSVPINASNICTQTDENAVKTNREKMEKSNGIDDKKKLREMLKEMKDSLPKRPKHIDKFSDDVIVKPTETPTLRIGSTIDDNMKGSLGDTNNTREKERGSVVSKSAAKEAFLWSQPSSSRDFPIKCDTRNEPHITRKLAFEPATSNSNNSSDSSHCLTPQVLVQSVEASLNNSKKLLIHRNYETNNSANKNSQKSDSLSVDVNETSKMHKSYNLENIDKSGSSKPKYDLNDNGILSNISNNVLETTNHKCIDDKEKCPRNSHPHLGNGTNFEKQTVFTKDNENFKLSEISIKPKKCYNSPSENKEKIEKIQLGNVFTSKVVSINDTHRGITVDTTRNKDLHTPLKISSLLNPLYSPKYKTTDKVADCNLGKILITQDTNVEINKKDSPKNQQKNLPNITASLNLQSPSTSNTKLLHQAIQKSEDSSASKVKRCIDPSEIVGDSAKTIIGENTSTEAKSIPTSCVKLLDHHDRRRNLINQLEQAISKGDEQLAAEAAAKLAKLKLACSVLSFSSQIIAEAISNKTEVIKNNTANEDNKTNYHVSASNLRVDSRDVLDKVQQENQKSTVCKKIIISTEASASTSSQIINDEIPIEVWVEDREAARGPIPMSISRKARMGELKLQVQTSLGLAIRLQRWIIGRTLCTDDNTPLDVLAGPDLNAPFYLCLVESETNKDNSPLIKDAQIKTELGQINNAASGDVYTELMKLEQQALVPNTDQFECGVCIEQCAVGDGVVLRECIHTFCRECLVDVIRHCEEPVVACPAIQCPGTLQEREIRAILSTEEYERWLARGLAAAESGTRNTFHCRTRDCKGWAFCEPGVRRFPCPVCKHTNCVPCQAVHEDETCEQYQVKLRDAVSAAESNQTDQGTQALLKSLISRGEALECPECRAIITKKWGCDWVKCSACKTEICWVTRGRRWGPGGKGDTSGGCRCGVDGKRCHPSCGYCH